MPANQIVRDQLFVLAGPIMALLCLCVVEGVQFSMGLDAVTLVQAVALPVVFAFLPLAVRTPRLSKYRAMVMARNNFSHKRTQQRLKFCRIREVGCR